jgi:hypothetical protein
MSTDAAGVADQVQPIDIRIGLPGSGASPGLPVIASEQSRCAPTLPSIDPGARGAWKRAALAAFAGAFLGCLATLHLGAFGIVPEIASASVTTLLGGLLLISRSTMPSTREFVPAVYGGAFGGMTSIHWPGALGSDHSIMLAGTLFLALSIVCGLAFSAGAVFDVRSGYRFTHGYGGRSGAIATVACLIFVQLAVSYGVDDRLFHAARADLSGFDLGSVATIIAACLAGTAVSLLVLRQSRVASSDLADKTFVASAIALAGLIVVRRISPTDALLLDAYYAGCFLGMSSRARLNGHIETLLGAVILAGLIIQVGLFLPGIGGGLGLAAFATVAVLEISRQFARFVVPGSRGEGMASRLATDPSPAGHSLAGPPSGRRESTWIGRSWRPAAAVAGLAVLAVTMGGSIWTTRFASNGAVPVVTASMSAVGEVAVDPAAPKAGESRDAADAAAPLAIADANTDPGVSDQTAPNQDPSKTGAADPVVNLFSVAVDERATGSEAPKAPIAAREPEIAEAQTTGSHADQATLFREFMQWRAARVVPNVRPNAAESQPRSRRAAGLAAASPGSPSRSVPSSSAEPATAPAARPRRPSPGSAPRAAIDQAVPASATRARARPAAADATSGASVR